MQEVVRKLLNALYHSVLNHVVRQLTFFSSDRAFRFFYVAFPEFEWKWITTISLWLYNKGWGGPLFQWFIGRIFCASKWCKVSFSYVCFKWGKLPCAASVYLSFDNKFWWLIKPPDRINQKYLMTDSCLSLFLKTSVIAYHWRSTQKGSSLWSYVFI